MNFVKKILAYPLSIIHYFFFTLILLIFHPAQWLAFNIGGYKSHKTVIDYMNLCLVGTLFFLGTRIVFNNKQNLPKNTPLILVSNHQSTHDIPPIIWFLRKYHPKFVSKIELGKGIPSVSYNLKHGGSVLIDRKNPRQSIKALSDFGTYIEKNKRSAVIFPEGTRSKDGAIKPFKEKGLKIMVKKIPSSYIVPITINNSWKIVQYGSFPLGVFNKIVFDVHQPIKSDSLPFETLFNQVEKTVNAGSIVKKS
ncbi:MAG: 1-acyl-sn-glycerol-3-phosphate acyltransferase [Flavobacteriaceae bacterium]|nr:1-acyl-sn-glycerol-3-phosphate acyltransferase [Flavobacteriaceae bacterium]